MYNVTYVRVYDSTPTTVYVGYTLGYTGCYPRGGVVVYGTGYRYSAWSGGVYYARPEATWGFAVRYNPYTDSWGFGVRVGRVGAWYGPALGAGVGEHQPVFRLVGGPGGYRDNGGYYSGNKVTVNQNTYNNYTNNVNNSKNAGNINVGNGSGNGNNSGNGNGNNIGNGNRPTRPGGGNGNDEWNRQRQSSCDMPGGEGGNSGRPGMGNRPGGGAETPARPRPGERPSQLPAQPGNRLPGRGEQPTQLPAGGGDNIYNRPGNRPIQAPSNPGKPPQPWIERPAGRPNNVCLVTRLATCVPARKETIGSSGARIRRLDAVCVPG